MMCYWGGYVDFEFVECYVYLKWFVLNCIDFGCVI